jgi:flagellar protein FlaF
MSTNPIDAYRNVEKATLSQRDLEATVLMQATTRLQDAKNAWAQEGHELTALDEALKYNQRVWSFFQAELTQDDNPLPADIKRNLLALSLYVDRRTFEVLAYQAPEKLDILININLNVAAGLRLEGG